MESYKGALDICRILKNSQETVFFVGGWVRDFFFFLKKCGKNLSSVKISEQDVNLFISNFPLYEVDIATSARPEKLKKLFPASREVGVQFGVVLVKQGNISYEVATFRGDGPYIDGRHPTSVYFSEPEVDAARRDFTMNGLFFDPFTLEVHDFVGGINDIECALLRSIGDPFLRFHEDKLRLLRAVRFATRFYCRIDLSTKKAIKEEASSLKKAVSKERVWQEFLKIEKDGTLKESFSILIKLKILENLFSDIGWGYFKEEVPLFKGKSVLSLLIFLSRYEKREKREKIFTYLPLSKIEKERFIFLENLLKCSLEENKTTDIEWVNLFASPFFEEEGKLFLASLLKKEQFLNLETKRTDLAFFIVQAREKKPLVQAKDLLTLGISPGKEMGCILKKIFETSVEKKIFDKETLLKLIKNKELHL